VLFVSVLAGGTLGYVAIERWSVWDAFYMTVTTVATVGYREVHALSRVGQAFTVLLIFSGVGTALYTFSLLATAIVEGGLPHRLRQRRQARMLEEIEGHFIVCGFGRIGAVVTGEFSRQQVPFVVVERDSTLVERALEQGYLALHADATDEEVLRRAGIARARGLIAAVGTDAENVYTVLTARVLRPDLFILARSEGADSIRKLRHAGADRVISPYQIGGQQLAQTAIRPAVVDFVELATSSENLELTMEEVTINGASPLVNRTILEANLRQRFGVIVVAIQRKDRSMTFNPEPEAHIEAGDKLVVLGKNESLKRLEQEASA
jgi:voltage-gated potassium channel